MDYLTNHEIILAARRAASGPVWDYICGGSESETTMRRNRLGLDSLAFRPRVLCDVSHIDTATSLLGLPSRLPVFLAPMASLQLMTPDAALAADGAAEDCGIVSVLSGHTPPGIEEVAANSPHGKIYQIYVRGGRAWLEELLGRVRAAGYRALAVTVDTAVYSNRERQMMAGWEPPTRRSNADGREFLAGLTWDDWDMIAEIWGGLMIIKGVDTAADARRAVAHGAACIYVSNHGGRQLDHNRATIAALPEVVDAVGDSAEVWIDGGFVRGTDIVKAIALGARAVGIGKLQAWALTAGGRQALVNCLQILDAEIRSCMGLLGVTALDQLGARHLARARPVAPAHEMSAFPHLPRGGRLT
jgi:glycolate oxidase